MADTRAYEDTPTDWHQRWTLEFGKADKAHAEWHRSAEMCTDRYLDESPREGERLNLFPANVNTQESMLYGQTPKVDVARKFSDQNDDVGRVAAEALQRVLNGDMERPEDAFRSSLRASLSDRSLAGFLGGIRFRYVRKTRKVPGQPASADGRAPAVPETDEVESEDVEADYFHWKDQKWAPARVFHEVRWWAFRTLLSRESVVERFGEEVAGTLPLVVKEGGKDDPPTPWDRAEIWEVYDKEHKCWWWYATGHSAMIWPVGVSPNPNGSLPDPLKIRGFYPFAEPKFANLTTRKFVPRPDYALSQDRYNAIDDETNRIAILRDALKVACVYDPSVGEFAQIFRSKGNIAIPAENYAALGEKGGLAGSVSWWDLSAIVAALSELRELRNEDIALLYQETGWSDIMRGQATSTGTTATEQAIKAKYGGVRVQKAQDEFASYASDAQRVRGEIVCKHFAPETIAQRANVQGLSEADRQYVPQALQLLKQDISSYRIVVKSEAISLTDYAANKQESMDVLGTIGAYMQSVTPIVEMAPPMAPMLLQILQALVARVKGGDAIEGALDQAIDMAQKAAEAKANAPPQPDPKMEAVKAKAQVDMAKGQMDLTVAKVKTGLELQKLQAKTQAARADAQTRVAEAQAAGHEPTGAPA